MPERDIDIDTAQLSSLSSALDDLARRVTEVAEQCQGSPRADLAAELYEVERHLVTAARRLKGLLDRAS
jgi:hypothetical protein